MSKLPENSILYEARNRAIQKKCNQGIVFTNKWHVVCAHKLPKYDFLIEYNNGCENVKDNKGKEVFSFVKKATKKSKPKKVQADN